MQLCVLPLTHHTKKLAARDELENIPYTSNSAFLPFKSFWQLAGVQLHSTMASQCMLE